MICFIYLLYTWNYYLFCIIYLLYLWNYDLFYMPVIHIELLSVLHNIFVIHHGIMICFIYLLYTWNFYLFYIIYIRYAHATIIYVHVFQNNGKISLSDCTIIEDPSSELFFYEDDSKSINYQ